jgi:hypothetical protein
VKYTEASIEHETWAVTGDDELTFADHVVALILEALNAAPAGHGETLGAQRKSNQIMY